MSESGKELGSLWRVSVATYNRVLFPHPQNGTLMLALERRATMQDGSAEDTCIWAQPFGGGVHILNPVPLQEIIGEIRYDSERSKREGDFRLMIPPSKWESIKEYCLHHLANPDDSEIESLPHRELKEEFAKAIHVNLQPDQYTHQPVGFVIENNPLPSDNIHARGQPTVRLYRIFEIHIIDDALCKFMLATSRFYSDQDLRALALRDFERGGKGHANSILVLPLDLISSSYLAVPPERRFGKIEVENHELDESVLAILADVDVPQYQKL